MGEELTLEILEKAVKQLKQHKREHEIIGYYVNPLDMDNIKKGLASIYGADETKVFVIPPYGGVFLRESFALSVGQVAIVRRLDG